MASEMGIYFFYLSKAITYRLARLIEDFSWISWRSATTCDVESGTPSI